MKSEGGEMEMMREKKRWRKGRGRKRWGEDKREKENEAGKR